jgi:hypothetical protein
MRIITLLVVVLFSIPSVFAIGVGFPFSLDSSSRNIVRIGDTYEHDFVIRGDDSQKEVEFFIVPEKTGFLLINEKTAFKENFVVGQYQDVVVPVVFSGSKEGDTKVSYGIRVIESSSSGIGFQQVIRNFFDIRVRCGDCDLDPPPVVPPSGGSDSGGSSSGSGGGSSGGGFSSAFEVVSDSIDSEEDELVVFDDVDVFVDDVVVDSIVPGGVSNMFPNDGVSSPVFDSQKVSVVSEENKSSVVGGSFLLVTSFVFSVVVILVGFKVVSVVRKGDVI